jgi:opacity protein-like surface antigen
MKGLSKALLIMAAVAASGLAGAQSADRAGSWETRTDVMFENSTKWDFDGGTTADIKSSTGFLLGFGWHYTDNLEFGANFEFDSPGYDAHIASNVPGVFFDTHGNIDNFRLMFDGTYNFLPGKFSPYVTAAIGWTWMDTNIATSPPQTGCWWDPWWGYICTTYQNTKTLNGFTYRLGAGVRYDINDRIALHASYKFTWTDVDNAKGTPDSDGFLLGIGWKFN